MGRVTDATKIKAEIPEIKELINDFDRRIRRLSQATNAGGEDIAESAAEIKEFVRRSLDDIMTRVRETAAEVGAPVAREASRVSRETAGRVADEVEQRPLAMLAAAVGIGFLVGFISRR